MDVIKFETGPKDDEYIYVCGCGCASFSLRGDGETLCRECNSLINTHPEQKCWHKGADSQVTDTAPEYNDGHNGEKFTERRTKERASEDDVTFLVFGRDDGTVTSWCRHHGLSEDQVQWFRDQISVGVEMMVKQ